MMRLVIVIAILASVVFIFNEITSVLPHGKACVRDTITCSLMSLDPK